MVFVGFTVMPINTREAIEVNEQNPTPTTLCYTSSLWNITYETDGLKFIIIPLHQLRGVNYYIGIMNAHRAIV